MFIECLLFWFWKRYPLFSSNSEMFSWDKSCSHAEIFILNVSSGNPIWRPISLILLRILWDTMKCCERRYLSIGGNKYLWTRVRYKNEQKRFWGTLNQTDGSFPGNNIVLDRKHQATNIWSPDNVWRQIRCDMPHNYPGLALIDKFRHALKVLNNWVVSTTILLKIESDLCLIHTPWGTNK